MLKERTKIKYDLNNLNTKYLMYHKRVNVSVPTQPNPAFGGRYLIQLNSYADFYKSLINIFHYYYNSIYQSAPDSRKQQGEPPQGHTLFNKFFIYMVDLYLLHDQYVEADFKFNQQQYQRNLKDIMQNNKVDQEQQHQLKKNLQKLLQIQKKLLKQMFNTEYEQESVKINKLKIIKNVKKQLFRKFLKDISNCILNEQMKTLYIPASFHKNPIQYIKYLLNTLHDIQFIKKQYKKQKIHQFVTNCKLYYKTEIPQHQPENLNLILIDRYTHNTDIGKKGVIFGQILVNMYDLVKIRRKVNRTAADNFQLIENIYGQLIKYERSTSKPYPLLDAKDIIFRQLGLTVALSYQKPLLQATGLLKIPLNVEQRICFKNTPALIDKFASPVQIQPNQNEKFSSNELHGNIGNQQIFYDLLYNNKKIKSELFDQSLGWRLLFIASYIVRAQQQNKLKGQQFHSLNHFYTFIKQQQQHLSTPNKWHLFQNVLSLQFKNQIWKSQKQKSQPFYQLDKGLSFFEEIFFPKANIDNMVQLKGFIKTNIFMKKISEIKENFYDTIKKHTLYKSIDRTVKYLILFYLSLHSQINNIKLVCEYCTVYKQKELKLLKELYKVLKSKEQNGSLIQTCMKKFNQYKEKYKKNEDPTLSYLFKKCQVYYKEVDRYYSLLGDLKVHVMKILKNRNELSSLNTERVNKISQNQVNTAQQISFQIVVNFFSKNKDTFDLIPVYSEQIIEKHFIQPISNPVKTPQVQLQSYRMRIMIKLLLYMNRYNFITLQSLVLPIIESQFIKKSDINNQIQMYQYALQIIKDLQPQPPKSQLQNHENMQVPKKPDLC